MDAGKFNNLNFGNIAPNRFNKPQVPNSKEAGDGAQETNTRDQVNLGSFSPSLNAPDFVSTPSEPTNEAPSFITSGNVARTEPTFSFSGPLGIDALQGVESQKFSNVGGGLTALNGINSTSIFSISGANIASVNPFSPVAATRMPTTSVSTFGIEDTQFITSSGRVISAEARPTVKMPTTSVTTFGLEDSAWLTTSGRTISL